MVALLVGRVPAKHDVLLGRASRPITLLDDEDEDDTEDEDEEEADDETEEDDDDVDEDVDEELDTLVDDEEELLDEVDSELLDDGDNASLPPPPPLHAPNNRHVCNSSVLVTAH